MISNIASILAKYVETICKNAIRVLTWDLSGYMFEISDNVWGII